MKIGKTKFYECPLSAITDKTWKILQLVNDTTNADGDILHLPFQGTISDQPQWFLDAVRIIKNERARHRQEQMDKAHAKK